MPPATNPVPYLVLANLETALALPNGDSNYYYTFNLVRRGTEITSLSQLPERSGMLGNVGSIGRYTNQKEGGALMHSDFHWLVEVVGVPPFSSDADEMDLNLYKMVSHILRPVMTDHTRRGQAANTTMIEFSVASAEGDQRPWISCTLDIQLRTPYNNMVSL